ncbi:MAG TPA: recombinase family protein [Fimbriimonadaceae bacterium]|nr:recombinase family protein [Fimbriimonadaceae bacterium]
MSDATGSATADRRAVAIYARKSNQTEGRSKSVQEQVEFCRAVVEALGLAGEVRVYADPEGVKGEWWWEDSRGINPKPWRPELGKLVRAIEAGEIGALVVWRSERLYRDAGVCDALARLLINHKVKLVMKGREVDPASSDGRFQVTVEAANNRRWRDQISEDVRRDHDLKARLGMFTRNPSCLGFRSKGKDSQAVTPVENELALVRRIFRMYVHGEGGQPPMSTTGIAKKLMREGVVVSVGAKGHKVKDNRVVHESQIRIILSNPMYVGKWKHNSEINDCPALRVCGPSGRDTAIPLELFEAAQAKLARPKSKNEKSRYSHHLLTGLVVCGGCGRPMQLGSKALPNGARARVYKCVSKDLGCPRGASVGVRDEVLDDWVVKSLLPLIRLEQSRLTGPDVNELEEELLACEGRLAEIRRRETQELGAALGVLDVEQIGALAARFRADRVAAEARLKELAERLRARDEPAQCLTADTLEDKGALKTILGRLLQWIALTKDGAVALTRMGSLFAADYDESALKAYKARGGARRLCAPSIVAAASCAAWFPRPAEFVRGRRNVLGALAEARSDVELLPFAPEDTER